MMLNDIFWSNTFWLPSNLTWNDLIIDGNSVMPSPLAFWMSVPVCVLIVCVRYFWEYFIAIRIGIFFGISNKSNKKFESDEVINKLLKKLEDFQHKDVVDLCVKETSWSSRQVERYIRDLKKSGKPTKMKKFTETSWFFIYHFLALILGVWILSDEKWLTDTTECWKGWPFDQEMSSELYWYYMIQIGYYMSLCVSLMFDVKRKDFIEMIVHHIATLGLLYLSYCSNFHRIGSVILLLHDPCDVLLHFGKMSKYANYQRVFDVMIVVFISSWFVTRIAIFPIKVVKPCLFDSPLAVSEPYVPHIHYVVMFMLCTLQILHFIWFGFMLKAVKEALINGGVSRDTRSDTESENSPSEHHVNGNNVTNNNESTDLKCEQSPF